MNSHIEVTAWAPQSGSDVCICGIGARTSVGLTAAASAAAVRASISGLGMHASFVDQEYEAISFAADPVIDADMPIADRMLQMLHSVVDEALSQLPAELKVGCCWLALPEQRSGLPADLSSWLATALSERTGLPLGLVRSLPRGHAGGLMALQHASEMLSRGEAETALVIGVDSYHDRQTVRSLDLRRRLMTARNPGGFPPGEAAGACLLVRSATAQRHSLRVLARIRAAATATESCPLRSNNPCLGEGLTAVLTSAASGLKCPQEQITATYCNLNGERYRNEEFVYALLRTQEAFVDAHDYVCPVDCWGDVGAASGPLFVILAVASGLRGYAKGDYPLLWAGSDSGYRAAILLALVHG